MDASAADNVAVNGFGFCTGEPLTSEMSHCTACLVVRTETVIELVLASKSSLTTRSMGWLPTGRTTTATTPVARRVRG